MVKDVVKEVINSGEIEWLLTAIGNVAERIKNARSMKDLFIETGRFLIDYEPSVDQEQFSDDLATVLSKDNMIKLANELNNDSGYTFKERLLSAMNKLMNDYEIPHEVSVFYTKGILKLISEQLSEIAPEKYDRYFQKDWRDEQKRELESISQKIDKISSELQIYKSNSLEIYSADQLDLQLRHQIFNLKMGIDFFDIDDDRFKEEFNRQKYNDVIYVRARCREEAIYCIINELWQCGEKRAIFIVKNKKDWDNLFQMHKNNNIYIPWFYADEIDVIQNNTNIFIYTDETPSFSQNEILLRPRMYHTINSALVRAGMKINNANSLVYETHGLYIPMKKKIYKGQYLKRPEWMEKLPEKVKLTGLLIGQWTDAEGDREIIQELSGMEYNEFIEQISKFSAGEDPFIYIVKQRNSRSYYLASVENTWEYLDISVDNPMWKRFRELFIEVLNESEKLFVYTTQERIVAQIKGEKLFWSSNIRNGMMRSLIMKAYYKNDTEFQSVLDLLIDEVLKYVKCKEQWRYLSNFFTGLCEIAPQIVLERLLKELEDPTGLLDLFEEQTSDYFWGRNDYTDILLGAEEFLVQKEYASKGFEWILKIDNMSYKYTGNLLKDVIGKVLCVWCNFSVFQSTEEKEYAAQMALRYTKNAWDYVYNALPSEGVSICGEIYRPKYRNSVELKDVTISQERATIEKYVSLLVRNADYDLDRWEKLLKIAYKLSENIRNNLFDSMLDKAIQMSELEKIQIKNSIREIIYRHRYFANASWSMGDAQILEYIALLDEIKISTPEYEYEYLFESNKKIILLDPVPQNIEDRRTRNDCKIRTVIKQKLSEFKDRKLDLSILAEVCAKDEKTNLGRYLALYGEANIFDENIFEILYEAQESRIMALDYCYIMSRYDEEALDKSLLKSEKLNYSDKFVAELYYAQALSTRNIPAIDTAPDNIKKIFWKKDRAFLDCNFEWALYECRKYGTVAVYVELLYCANEKFHFKVDELYKYILGINKMECGANRGAIEYYLAELLKPLQENYIDDVEKAHNLAEIEITFGGIIGWDNMICFKNEIKNSPETYAYMASIIFKRDNDDKHKKKTEEQKNYAKIIHHFFDMVEFCPTEKNGIVNTEELEKWVIKFKEILDANDQSSYFGFLLGRLWAYAPIGKDGRYPCEAVRLIIEKYSDEDMLSEYEITVRNQRGVYNPSAGQEEKNIAEKYKENADYLSLKYPNTAKVFYELYRTYMKESENERISAENGYF